MNGSSIVHVDHRGHIAIVDEGTPGGVPAGGCHVCEARSGPPAQQVEVMDAAVHQRGERQFAPPIEAGFPICSVNTEIDVCIGQLTNIFVLDDALDFVICREIAFLRGDMDLLSQLILSVPNCQQILQIQYRWLGHDYIFSGFERSHHPVYTPTRSSCFNDPVCLHLRPREIGTVKKTVVR